MVEHATTLGVGNVVSRTLSIWGKNFVPFSILGLIVMSPVLLLCLIFPLNTPGQATAFGGITSMAATAASLVASAAVAYGVFQQMRGQTVALGQCVSVGMQRLLPVLGVSIVVGLVVMLGLLLLVVPGIIAMCVYYVAVPVAVMERLGVGGAMERSATLTRGTRWAIFGIAIVLGLIGFAASLVIGMFLPDPADSSGLRIHQVVTLALSAVIGTLTSVGSVVVYHDLRVQKEHADLDKITAVFN